MVAKGQRRILAKELVYRGCSYTSNRACQEQGTDATRPRTTVCQQSRQEPRRRSRRGAARRGEASIGTELCVPTQEASSPWPRAGRVQCA